ncbi:hypothetical protein QYE76_017650 [Lolium multiflorum]|uniref:Uncharacterized protein n=1 Tax=Lolium multiflorum TaxID=4521 RepID=A0AAD8VAW5_LOLMU|nr:hypothetical protein QYE76_017650 [Lolium multiflorum]
MKNYSLLRETAADEDGGGRWRGRPMEKLSWALPRLRRAGTDSCPCILASAMAAARSSLAEENLCAILRVPDRGDAAEEVPDGLREEEEQNSDYRSTRTSSQEPITKYVVTQRTTDRQQTQPSSLHRRLHLVGTISLPGQEHSTLSNSGQELKGASSSLATTSSELENLRSSYQELETKLMEAEQKKEQAEKQLAEKNSELIREKGEFLLKRNVDSETIKRQQKELNGPKYMETVQHHSGLVGPKHPWYLAAWIP